jgi:mannosyltransferase
MLVIDGIIFSLQRHGGISVYFNELLQRLSTDNIVSHVIGYQGSSSNFSMPFAKSASRHIRPMERYRRCPVPSSARLFHSSYYRLPAAPVPVVTTVHDFIYERFATGPRKWLHSWQKFAAIRSSHAVICISESTRRDLFQFLPDIDPERVHVIHNGVSDAFHPLEGKLASQAGRPYVLFIGARTGYKNFAPLLHAMAGLPDYDLVCVGGGRLTEQESAFIQSQLGNRFKHHMNVPDADLNRLYNEAFCLAYPTSYEGFGIPVLEAMRAGCPVISVASSSIPEVAGDAAQLIQEADPDLLKQAITQLEQGEIWQHYRSQGLQRAMHFSWDKTYAETRQIYSTLLAN